MVEKHTIDGFNAGVALACAQADISPEGLLQKVATAKEAVADVTVQTAIAKIASAIFVLAGQGFEKEAAFYEAVSRKTEPLHSYCSAMFIEPVLEALSKEASMEKAAFSTIAGYIGKTVGKAVPLALDSAKTLSTLATLGGLGVGGLVWALNRDINQEDLDTEMKLEQARHYRKIADDIKRSIDLKSAGSKDSAKLKKALKEESDASYVL